MYTVQVRIYDSEGKAGVDTNASTVANLKVKIQGTGIGNNTAGNSIGVALDAGIATITVKNDDGATNLVAGDDNAVTGPGTARIILSYPGANDIALPAITVTETTEAAPSS